MSLTPTKTTTTRRRGECVDGQGVPRSAPVPSLGGGWRLVVRARGGRAASRFGSKQRRCIVLPSAAARGHGVISSLTDACVVHNARVLLSSEPVALVGRAMITLTSRGAASGIDCAAVVLVRQGRLRCSTPGAASRDGLELAA